MKFDFSRNHVLENRRVLLEPLIEEHFNKLKEISTEKEIWTYFLGESNGSENFEKYIQDAIDAREKRMHYTFAVFDKEKDRYAGCTRFFDFDFELDVVRLGYSWYGKDFRGTGLNKNCKFLLFCFAFEHMQVERVGLGAHSENMVSIAAMKSVGLQEEGRVRNAFPSIHKNGRSDAVLLGILKKEWHNTVKNNLNQRL